MANLDAVKVYSTKYVGSTIVNYTSRVITNFFLINTLNLKNCTVFTRLAAQ